MRSLLLCLALALPVAASAQTLYRWVDKDGTVRYSDIPPPPGVPVRTLGAPSSAPPASDASASQTPKTLDEREKAFQKRREEQQKADEKAAAAAKDEAVKAENCRRARESLATLESGQRILRTSPQGEQYYVDDAQRAQETQQARQAVQEWCN